MKKHLHLATRDLDASVAFYRTLLLAEPVKHYADYALFRTDEPGLELALDLDPATDPYGRRWETYYVLAETESSVASASPVCG